MMRYSTAITAVVLLAVASSASGAFTGSGSGEVSLSGSGLGLLSQVLISDIPDQTVTIGRNATFICNASSDDGDPILAYSWIRDGMVLSDGSTTSGSQVNGSSSEILLIVGVTDGDGGNYSCCASDSIGVTNTSNTAILTVVEPPRIAPIGDETVTIGSMASLRCDATSSESRDVAVRWTRDNDDTFLDDPRVSATMELNDMRILELTIINFGTVDQGDYTCIATNPDGEDTTETATLTVTGLPEFSPPLPPTTVVEYNQSLSLSCRAFNGPNVTNALASVWQRNGIELMEDPPKITITPIALLPGINLAIGTLTITRLVFSDTANYTCLVYNREPVDGVTSTTEVTVIAFPPMIITQPEDQLEVTPGTAVIFTVEATGTELMYQWQRSGSDLTDGGRFSGTTTSALIIMAAEEDDEDTYQCIVSNIVGNETSGAAQLTVLDTPTITVQPLNQTNIRPGTPIAFSIAATGLFLSYSWQRNGIPLIPDPIHLGADSDTLSFTGVRESDEGSYRCNVSNAAGSVVSNIAYLTVIDPPTLVDPTQPEDLLEATPGDTITFTVVAAGDFLMYTWQRNTVSLFDMGKFSGTNTPTLTITDVREEEESTYRCVVSNVIRNVTSRGAQLTVFDPPTIIQGPQDQNEAVGTNVTFTCVATGLGSLTATWTTTASTILPDSTETLDNDTITSILVLTSVGAIDGGDYTCEITNEAGSVDATTTLYIIPLIVTQPMDVLTVVGRIEELSCVAEGFPEPVYQWQKQNTSTGLYVNIQNANDPVLNFSPVAFGDEGTYQCVASNVAGNAASNTATFTVSPQGSVVVSPPNVTAEFNDTVTFMCSAQGGLENTFQWMHGPDVLINETRDTLVFGIFSSSDGGYYTCVVRNAAGSENATVAVYIIPRISRQPTDILTTNGTMENFACIAEGFPDPMYRWERLEMPGSSSGSVIPSATDSLLEFSPVVFGDEGYYLCVASLVYPSEVMLPDIERESRLATLTVSPEGSVEATPPVFNAIMNGAVNFTCIALGGPGNTFTWTRLFDTEQVATNPLLTVAVRNAFDGSVYQCSVENDAGSEEDSVTLNVFPVILVPPLSMNVTSIQDDIILTCNASGFPVPMITWTHNDTTVSTSGRTSITVQSGARSVMSSLVVSTAMTNDSGQYECIVSSSEFESIMSGPVTVLVQDRPEQPQNVAAVDVNSRNITLVWVEPHDNNAPIQGYRIMYQRPSFLGGTDEIVDASIETAVITGLHPGVTYNFTVVAFNEIGVSDPSEVLPVPTLEEVPSNFPQAVQANAISSTAIEVTWEQVPPSNRNGFITYYEIFYEPLITFGGMLASASVNISSRSPRSAILSDLQEFVDYNISIRAFTEVGAGPFSPIETERTFQDVPAVPPVPVQVTVLSPTAIQVVWSVIPEIDRNGIITMYEVLYEPLETFGGEIATSSVNITVLNTTLEDLQEYVEYNISVRAYTTIGPGPYSFAMMFRTFEDVPSDYPQRVQATTVSSTEILVAWSQVPDIDQNGIITQYDVQLNQSTFTEIDTTELRVTNGSELSLSLGDLQEYVEYSISVRALTSIGPGPFSPIVSNITFQDVPSNVPQDVQATTVSSTEIRVTWNEVPEIDRNGNITQYEVQYEPLETFGGQISTLSVTTMDLEVVLQSLEEDVDYNISVRAYTIIGPGPFSEDVTQRTSQDFPSNFPQDVQTTTVSSTEIRVTWNEVPEIDRNGNITQYEVQYEPLETFGGQISNLSVITMELEVVLQSLEEDVDYNISVRAYTIIGSGPFSEDVTQRTFQDFPSNVPQDVQTTTVSSTEIRVTWNEVPEIDRNGNITQYEVQYEPLETFGGQISNESVTTMELEVVLRGLQEDVDYNISVRAYTTIGPGPFSEDITQRTSQDYPSGYPQMIKASTVSPTEIQVTWEEVPPIERNGIITRYEVQFNQSSFTQILASDSISTTGPVLEILLSSLEEYVEYSISVRAYTEVGAGPFNPNTAINITDENVPVATPASLTLETASSNKLNVSWERPEEININGDLRFYIIQYQILDQADTRVTVNVSGNTLSTMLVGLNNFTNYTVSVAAYTIDTGPFTSEVESTAENVPGMPPQDVQGTPLSSTSISVEWDPPPEEFLYGILTEYSIRYVPMDGTNTTNFETTGLITSTTLENLLEFTNYSIEVTAVTVGDGPYSDPIFIRTDPDVPGEVSTPPEVSQEDIISSTSVTVRWDPPIDPNGEITRYTVNFVATSSTPESGRKRQAPVLRAECIRGGAANVDRDISVEGNPPDTFVTLDNLTPYSTYEFSVQAETIVGPGAFSPSQTFSTPEDVPTEPRNLTVMFINSTALDITWEEPLCDYGIRTEYTVEYVSDTEGGEQGNPRSPHDLNEDISGLVIVDLTPNTVYNVTVSAYTSTGRGISAFAVEQTDEDIPQAVTELSITSMRNPNLRNRVIVEITWVPPSVRNGSFNYNLTYTADQALDYPQERKMTAMDSAILGGEQQQFIIENALPYAIYDVRLFAFNIRRGLPGPDETGSHRSIPIEPTAVTNLKAVATSFKSIEVTWELPEYPNGPIQHYLVYHNESDSVQQPPITSDDYMPNTEGGTKREISGLMAYTNYSIHVQPIGGVSAQELRGDIDEEILQRTNSTIPTEPPTVPEPEVPTEGATTGTIFVYLAPPSQIKTGKIIFYAIIVINTGMGLQVANQSTFEDAGPYNALDLGQTYYITAAWSDAASVPTYFIIGNGSTTEVQGVTYLNARLASGTEYAIFYRMQIESDDGSELFINSPTMTISTASPSSGANAGGIAAGVVISLLVVGLIIAGVIIGVIYWKKRSSAYKVIDREFAGGSSGGQLLSVITNPLAKLDHSTHEPITVQAFAEHVKYMHSNDDYLFSEEYSSVEPDHAPTTEATLRPENQSKNRYANITSYDHSRVKLREVPGLQGSDYINANHIDGYRQPKAFIGTQGPVPASVSDFWRMVWEQGTATIVMVTNLEEKGRLKCHKYWPDEKSALYGLIRVHIQEVLVLAEYTVRTFSLQREGSREERIVKQFHFTVWPDHGVPEYPTPLLHFVRKVTSSNPINAGPIVVHCSAGVGRTGTFITLHAQLKRIKAEGNVDIFNFVRSMRRRRCFMVQTEPQYVFIHDALLEAIECGESEVPARDLRNQYMRLGEVDEERGKTRFQLEFEKLDSTIHRRPARNSASLPTNKQKNRYTDVNVLPYDKSRCRLTTIPGSLGSDYINASFISGYHKSRAFIATQGPLPDTTEDFWRMIWEQNCATIMSLTKVKEGGRIRCHRYWPESGAETYGQYQVILHSVNEYPDYILREFKIVDTKDGSSIPVKQFHYMGWTEEGPPDTGSGLIDLIGQVQKWQMNSGDRPVVVHCSAGCGRTGTFIAASILLERLKTEGVVDVFHTVRGLRLQRPGMVQSLDQYVFIYKTVLEFLDSFELYSNFK